MINISGKDFENLMNPILQEKMDINKSISSAKKILMDDSLNEHLEVIKLVSEYYKSKDINLLNNIALSALQLNILITPETLIKLVVHCYLEKDISAFQASKLICKVDYEQRKLLDEKSRALVKVSEHVFEDENEGFISVNSDNFFQNAINKYLNFARDS